MATLDRPVSFIATSNSVDSRHFYEVLLNLTCLSEDDFAIVFDLGSTTLRIQKLESMPQVNHTVLGWEVDNIEKTVSDLSTKGVQFETFSQLPQNDLGIWCSPSGASIAWFKDPDGNTLSLTQQ